MSANDKPLAHPRHDRILPLAELNAYPGSNRLDLTLWLPPSEDGARRLWMMTPAAPVVWIDEASFAPQTVVEGPPRWLDYGVVTAPTGFTQLRLEDLPPADAAASSLLLTTQLEQSFDGMTIAAAERELWGLARADAGSTTLSPARLPVGSPASFTVRYAAGRRGLPAGAMVRFAVPRAFDQPQLDDPARPGFVEIRPAAAAVVANIGVSVESHEKIDILCRLERPLTAGAAFELHYQTAKMCLFPLCFAAVDRRYWYSKLPPLSAAVALPDAPFVSPLEGNGHCFETTAGPATRLHLFLPGRRRGGEDLRLHGIFTDAYRNVPPTGTIDVDFELFLVEEGGNVELGAPDGCFTARHRFGLDLPPLEPGVYRAVARRTGSGEVLARSNPMQLVAADSDVMPVYWGEIHAHSQMSDGSGDFAGLFRHARDDGCLDFAAAADHACYFSDNQWQWMQDVVNSFDHAGEFTTLIGYEWAGKQVHRNVYTRADRLTLFRGMYEPTSQLNVLFEHFHGNPDVVAGPHGGLAHGLLWEHHDPAVERFLEIYSMWGANDQRDNPLIPEFARRNARGMTANEVLQTGARLGFTGGGDCHEGRAGFSSEDPNGQGRTSHTFAERLFYRCGMTAAVMPALDRRALVDALRQRRTYATTGTRILLDFYVSDIPMGAVSQAAEAICQATVHGEDEIARLEIVKDGNVVHVQEPNALDATLEWPDPEPLSGEHYYYVHVTQRNAQQAWSSPIWLTQP